jgi:ubiquinone biosynthesis protein Coq4
MGFRYLDRITTEENIHGFLELADLAAGAGASTNNVFLLSQRLREANPIKVCRALLGRDPASAALIRERRLCGPYDLQALQALPKGTLGHTYATVLQALG